MTFFRWQTASNSTSKTSARDRRRGPRAQRTRFRPWTDTAGRAGRAHNGIRRARCDFVEPAGAMDVVAAITTANALPPPRPPTSILRPPPSDTSPAPLKFSPNTGTSLRIVNPTNPASSVRLT